MAVQLIRGFDHENSITDLLAGSLGGSVTGNTGISLVAGRFGGKCLEFATTFTANSVFIPLVTNIAGGSALFCGHAINLNGTGSTGYFGVRSASGNMQFYVYYTATTVSVYRAPSGTTSSPSSGGTLLGSFSYTLTGWHYMEIKSIVALSTSGSISIRMDGASSDNLTITSANTCGDGTDTTTAQIMFGCQTAASSNGPLIDDFYALDTTGSISNLETYLGDITVQPLFVTANSGSPAWTPLASTNASQVLETAMDSDTSYNSSGTLNAQDLFTHGTLTGTPSTIFAVQATLAARKDSSGARGVSTVVSSSGTVSVGGTITLGSSYQYSETILPTDPATGAAWTASGVNAALLGYKLTL